MTLRDRRSLLPGLTVLALTAILLALWTSANDRFLFDDRSSLEFNTALSFDPGRAIEWRSAIASGAASALGRPVSMASFALQSALEGGFSPTSLRRVNALLHVAIALLLIPIGRILFEAAGEPRGRAGILALGVALLWALSPLHVSTVLYPVQRMAQLAALFFLLGYWAYLKQRAACCERHPDTGALLGSLLLIALCTLLATLSKENGILLLWAICWTEWALFRGRWAGSGNRLLRRLALAGCILPLSLTLWIVMVDSPALMGGYANRDFSLHERLLTQARIGWDYLHWILFPPTAAYGFTHDDVTLSTGLLAPASTLLSVVAWLLVLAVLVALRRRWPMGLFALGFFLITHFLESTVLPLELVFEHRNYLPSFGMLLILVSGLGYLCRRLQPRMPRIAPALALAALLCFAVPFALRLWIWSDPLALAQRAVALHPQSPRAHFFVAAELEARARADGDRDADALPRLLAARQSYTRMLEVSPERITARVLLYRFDSRFFPGNPEQEEWLRSIIPRLSGRPLDSSERNALGALFDCLSQGCPAPAEDVHRLLSAIDAQYPDQLALRADAVRYRLRSGDTESAMEAFERLRRRAPGDREIAKLELDFAASRGDSGAALDAIVELYRRDRRRQQLMTYSAMLGEPP